MKIRKKKSHNESTDQHKNDLFESLYDNAPFAFQSLDEKGKFINVNTKWEKELAYTLKDVKGKQFEDFVVDEYKDLFRENFKILLEKGETEPLIIKLITKNRKHITVKYEGCITKNQKGKFVHTNCALQNITELILKEEEQKRTQELDDLRTEIWKAAALINNEKRLIQVLLDKVGPVLGSENISFMPYNEKDKNVTVEQIWRKDGTKDGIGEPVPGWIFNQFKKKSHIYFSFENMPAILKPVLKPFQKKYGTKTTLVIPYGDPSDPRGYLSSQTYKYDKKYSEAEINVFIEISNIIYLKSKQLQSKKALEESQKRLRNLTEQTNEAIIIHKNGNIIEVNPSALKMFGVNRHEIINNSIFDYIHPQYKEIVIERVRIGTSDLFELELIRKDGTVFFAETKGKYATYKDQDVRVISINDITDRKKTEKEILKLSATVEQSPLSIVITDIKGNLEYVNPRFLETTGYTKEEVIGHNPRILATGKTTKEEYRDMWDTIVSGNVWNGEFLNKRKDGSTYWEEATIAPVKNKLGNIVNFVGLKVNITEKKEAENKLTKSQEELEETLRTRDKIYSIISHDLRNPFNAILGFSEILLNKSKEKDFEGFEELSSYVHKSAKQSFELLENLLHWSRIQSGKIQFNPEEFFLKDSTKNVFELLRANADDKRISLNILFKEDITVMGDRFMLETIIRNLVSNAIKFTQIGGKIDVLCKKTKKEVIYTVADNGIGMKPEIIDTLFNVENTYSSYGTKDESGTGLGLILCKEFVERHRGRISVKSEYEKGSQFTFTIPVSEK